MLVYICVGLNETQVNDSGPCIGGVGDTVAECRRGELIAGWAVGGEVSNAVLLLKLVLELITDSPISGQLLYSRWLTCPQLIIPIELIYFEPPRSRHFSTPNNRHWSVPDIP